MSSSGRRRRQRVVPENLAGLVALLSFAKGAPLVLGWLGVLLGLIGVGEVERGAAAVGTLLLALLTAGLAAQVAGVFRSRDLLVRAAATLTVVDVVAAGYVAAVWLSPATVEDLVGDGPTRNPGAAPAVYTLVVLTVAAAQAAATVWAYRLRRATPVPAP